MRELFTSLVILTFLLTGCSEPDSSYFKTDHSEIEALLSLARELRLTNSDTALVIARRAHTRALEEKYREGSAGSNLLMGEILYDMGGLSQANKQLTEALTEYTSLGNMGRTGETQILLSRVYQRSENYDRAYLYLNQARRTYKKLNDQAGLAKVYGELGHVYEKKQWYDSALRYQHLAMEIYSIQGDTLGLASINDNMGSIYEDLAIYDKAFIHFHRALELNESVGNHSSATVNLNNLGDVYRKQGNLPMAFQYTNLALDYATLTHQEYQLKSAYRDLSKIYFTLGKNDSAYHFLEKSYDLTDQLFSNEIAEEIARTQAIYELQQKQEQIVYLENSRAKNRLMALISGTGIFLIALFGSMIFYQQRSKNKKAKQLFETEAELARFELENARLSEQNLKTELENNQLKEEQLRQELDLQSRTLTKSTLHMIQKNEFLQLMRTKLRDLKKADPAGVQKVVKRLIRSIDMNFSIDDDWHEFETVFQQVHNDFFIKLKEFYPDLSPSEVRLCAMIRLNLHSKDIAAIMGISQDSLRTSRYRLRKRLGIKKGTSLYAYIINIG
jgi:tetratricopeptide (TPR) repeat protein/DNA-binding CsgD family transcriptional regulator